MSTDQDLHPAVAAVLDGVGPGPELGAMPEQLSPAALTGDDLAAYLRACARCRLPSSRPSTASGRRCSPGSSAG